MRDLELIKLVGDVADAIGAEALAGELENLKRKQVAPATQRIRRQSDGRLRGEPEVREGADGPVLYVRKMVSGVRKPFYGKTREDIEAKIEQFKSGDLSVAGAGRSSTVRPTKSEPDTLFQALDRFIAQYPHQDQSAAAVEYAIKRVLRQRVPEHSGGGILGELSAYDTDTEDLQLVLNHVAAHGNARTGSGLALNTVRNSKKGVSQFFDFCEVTWGWPNHAQRLVVPKAGLTKLSSKDVHPYRSWDEVYALSDALNELGHPELSRWLRWGCGTGERIEESIVKRECDLVRANGEARVHRARMNRVEVEMTKFDSAATYYLTDVALEVLDEIPPDIRRDPHEWQNSPLLWPWHLDGGHIDVQALRRRDPRARNHGLWRSAHELAGLAYRPPKQMRHTFAYLALTGGGENGKPELRWALEDVSTQLRHSSIAVTVDYYLDLVPQMLRRTAAQMTLGTRPNSSTAWSVPTLKSSSV